MGCGSGGMLGGTLLLPSPCRQLSKCGALGGLGLCEASLDGENINEMEYGRGRCKELWNKALLRREG